MLKALAFAPLVRPSHFIQEMSTIRERPLLHSVFSLAEGLLLGLSSLYPFASCFPYGR